MEFLDIARIKLSKYPVLKKALLPFNYFIRNYNQYRLNRAYKKYGSEAFNAFCRALNSSDSPYWPEFGTLLGIFREGDFIKHDNDFDFGTFYQNRDSIISVLNNAGLKLISTYRCLDIDYILEDTFSYRGVHIDVFYFHSKGEKDYCHTFIPFKLNFDSKLLYKIKVFEFDRISLKDIGFKGLRISIPSDTESHLKVPYGKNFMTPDPNFKSITHTFLEGHYAIRNNH